MYLPDSSSCKLSEIRGCLVSLIQPPTCIRKKDKKGIHSTISLALGYTVHVYTGVYTFQIHDL